MATVSKLTGSLLAIMNSNLARNNMKRRENLFEKKNQFDPWAVLVKNEAGKTVGRVL